MSDQRTPYLPPSTGHLVCDQPVSPPFDLSVDLDYWQAVIRTFEPWDNDPERPDTPLRRSVRDRVAEARSEVQRLQVEASMRYRAAGRPI